jgi:hypothetical protein
VKLQEKVVLQTTKRKLEAKRTSAEVKISVYEKAFEHCPSDTRLVSGYLSCCQDILE